MHERRRRLVHAGILAPTPIALLTCMRLGAPLRKLVARRARSPVLGRRALHSVQRVGHRDHLALVRRRVRERMQQPGLVQLLRRHRRLGL